MTAKRLRAYFYLLIVTMIWGFAAPIIKYTLQGFDPGTFLVYRFFISAAISAIYFSSTKNYTPKKGNTYTLKIILYGFLATTFSLGALFLGLERTTVLDANLITSLTPLLIVVAGAVFLKEKVPGQEKLGAAIAFLGTLVAIILPIIQGSESEIQFSGDLFIIAHVISDIAALLLVKELLKKKVSSALLSNISFIIGFLTLTPFVLLHTPFKEIITNVFATPLHYHLGVWYMAVLSGTLAYYLRNKAQKDIEVGNAGLFGYLHPLFSTPLAVFWLGERITASFIIGALLIIIGVLIAEISGKSRKKAHPHLPHLAHHK